MVTIEIAILWDASFCSLFTLFHNYQTPSLLVINLLNKSVKKINTILQKNITDYDTSRTARTELPPKCAKHCLTKVNSKRDESHIPSIAIKINIRCQ